MRPSSTAATATPPPSASAAPPSPKNPGASTKRQRKSAAPLGDVTNLLPLRPETPTPIKPRRNPRRSLPAPSSASPSAASSTCSSASVTPALNPSSSSSSASATPAPSSSPAPQPSSSATVTPAPRPRPPSTTSATPAPAPSSAATASATPTPEASSAADVTPAPKPSFAAVLQEEGETPTICTAYARRRTTEVEAAVRRKRNPTVSNKDKEPVGAAASCPPLGKSTRNTRKKDTRPIFSSAPCHEAKKKRPLASTPKLPEEFVKKQKAYFADVDAFELVEEEVSESELE